MEGGGLRVQGQAGETGLGKVFVMKEGTGRGVSHGLSPSDTMYNGDGDMGRTKMRKGEDLRLGSRGATSDCITLKLPGADPLASGGDDGM